MHLIRESTQAARKRYVCEECGRHIEPGVDYLRQRVADGGDAWTFRAHCDCAALGDAYRTKHKFWGDRGDWYPMYDLIEPQEFNEWRGHFPHAICRLEFNHQTRD